MADRTVVKLGGHRQTRLGRSPFGSTVPGIVAAALYAWASMIWAVFGDSLPGGRWLAVHLFTLGVLSNLILTFSEHFGRTLTRQPARSIGWQHAVFNAGVLGVLVGLPSGNRWLLASGAIVVTIVVAASYLRLRRMRRAAVGARFGWIVRLYERAHGAFLHGAILGIVMGTGLVRGPWYLSAKIAHLHVNVLGWAGVTLLATLVFFGPTMARTRIRPGSDERAARVLRHGVTALGVAALLLFGSGAEGSVGLTLRLAAALLFGVFAAALTVVCYDITTAVRAARPSAARWGIIAAAVWFPVAAWVDVVIIASGRWVLLDALAPAILAGVLAQVILTVLGYLAPMLLGRTFTQRDQLLARFEYGTRLRTTTFNVGVVVAAAGPVVGQPWVTRIGWATVMGVAVLHLLMLAIPVARDRDHHAPPTSAVARRYRHPDG